MREKTMKRGHLLLTLLAFVSLMWLGTIHANAAMVKAKVDSKKILWDCGASFAGDKQRKTK